VVELWLDDLAWQGKSRLPSAIVVKRRKIDRGFLDQTRRNCRELLGGNGISLAQDGGLVFWPKVSRPLNTTRF